MISPGDRGWMLGGSAEQTASAVELYFCCVAASSVSYRLPSLVTPAHWTVAIEHANTECRDATLAFVYPLVQGPHSAFAIGQLRAGVHGGITRLDFDVDVPQPLDLVFGSEGGLECCGRTRITRIAIVARPE